MRKILFILPLLMFVAVACCNCPKEKSTVVSASTMRIKLSKSACYGKCPEYAIELKDGKFFLEAGSNTPLSGSFVSDAEDSEIAFLLALVKENDILGDLRTEEYDQNITDLPRCTMNISSGDKQKTIRYRVEVPKNIISIDNFLGGLLNERSRWASM